MTTNLSLRRFIKWTTLVALALIVLHLTVALLNPQWNKYIFMCQAYYGIDFFGLARNPDEPPPQYSGVWRTWYRNGKLSDEFQYVDGKKRGKQFSHHTNGRISSEYNLNDDGQLDGEKMDWFQNGQRQAEERYRRGKKDGEFVRWFENGTKSMEEHHVNDRREGSSIVWDKYGHIKHSMIYKNDHPFEGTEENFFRDCCEETDFHGGHGDSRLISTNGVMLLTRTYENGLPWNGLFAVRDSNAVKTIPIFFQAKVTGRYSNGVVVEIIRSGTNVLPAWTLMPDIPPGSMGFRRASSAESMRAVRMGPSYSSPPSHKNTAQ